MEFKDMEVGLRVQHGLSRRGMIRTVDRHDLSAFVEWDDGCCEWVFSVDMLSAEPERTLPAANPIKPAEAPGRTEGGIIVNCQSCHALRAQPQWFLQNDADQQRRARVAQAAATIAQARDAVPLGAQPAAPGPCIDHVTRKEYRELENKIRHVESERADACGERDRLRSWSADMRIRIAWLERENERLTGALKKARGR